jgi:hypothetical protein
MSSLYQLTEEVVALDALLAEVGGDVSTPEGQTLEAWAEQFQWQMSDKVDAYGALYKNLEADAKAIADEVKRLTDRRRTLENRAARLLALAKFSMDRLHTRKLEGQRFTIVVQKAGGVAPVELLVERPEDLPASFQRTTVSADNEAIREALEKKDPSLEGKARLGERGEYVRIK